MPNENGRGPLGQGSMTGRGLGPCSEGMSRGFGKGMGRCMRRMPYSNKNEKEILEQEKTMLESEKKYIEEELKAIDLKLKDLNN